MPSLDNIFVCKDSIIKLIDFGAAKSMAFASGKSISVVVKPNYAPPEQFNSRGSLGPWSDIYALGATMYRLVTGTMPVEAISRLMWILIHIRISQIHIRLLPMPLKRDMPPYI